MCGQVFSFFGGHYASDLLLRQASLSPSLGGFGLRFFPEYQVAAYLSSLIMCFPTLSELLSEEEKSLILEDMEACYACLLSDVPQITLPSLKDFFAKSKIQSLISQRIDQTHLEALIHSDNVSLRDKARLMGCSTKYAAAWISSPPNKKKGKHFDDQSLSLLLKYWLGIPIFAARAKCHCGMTLDMYGDHAIHCKSKGNVTKRHDHVRDIFFRFLQGASVPVSKEVVGFKEGQKSRLGDLILHFGGNGLNTDAECLFDVTIYSSLYDNRLQKSSVQRESAAELSVRNKLSYRNADQNGFIETSRGLREFVPLGFEALGGFSSNSKRLVDFIANEWSVKSGLSKSVAKSTIISKISVGIQRGNAMCLADAACASLTRDLDH